MALLIAYAVALLFALVLIVMHYEVLALISRVSRRLRVSNRLRVTGIMFAILVFHTLAIGIYAFAYVLLGRFGLGGFTGSFQGTVMEYYHISAISYTTLGMTPNQTTGAFGVASALQGLIGFSLITWSATFAYSIKERLWKDSTMPGIPRDAQSREREPPL